MDNSQAFRSATVSLFKEEWGVSLRICAANVPSDNGIFERNHRTIKRIVCVGYLKEATFWYNLMPGVTRSHDGPTHRLFKYPWRIPYDVNVQLVDNDKGSNVFSVGDEKPSVPSCTKLWALLVSQSILSALTACLGMYMM